MKGVFRCLFMGEWRENCLKAERRSGVAVLAISATQNCLRLYAPAISYESVSWDIFQGLCIGKRFCKE